jgi:hypothetical protein
MREPDFLSPRPRPEIDGATTRDAEERDEAGSGSACVWFAAALGLLALALVWIFSRATRQSRQAVQAQVAAPPAELGRDLNAFWP